MDCSGSEHRFQIAGVVQQEKLQTGEAFRRGQFEFQFRRAGFETGDKDPQVAVLLFGGKSGDYEKEW